MVGLETNRWILNKKVMLYFECLKHRFQLLLLKYFKKKRYQKIYFWEFLFISKIITTDVLSRTPYLMYFKRVLGIIVIPSLLSGDHLAVCFWVVSSGSLYISVTAWWWQWMGHSLWNFVSGFPDGWLTAPTHWNL